MEKIGLAAVMEMADFTKGINDYNKKIDDASGNTETKAGKMTGALSKIGAGIGNVAKIAAGAAIGGIAALTTAMIGGVMAATSWAEKVDSVGDVLGTTAEESSALAVAAQLIGGDVTQLSSQMAILTRGLFDAKGEIGPTGLVLQEMGIAFQDANGQMLPTTEILQAVADKIGSMPDGLEKTKLMMELFGKSGKDMSDMMGILANGGMAAMDEKAKALGLSMSEDATQGAIQFGRSMNELKMTGQGLLVMLGNALLPILQPLLEGFLQLAQQAMPYIQEAIKSLMPYIQQIFTWLGEKIPPIIKDLVSWFNEHLRPALLSIWESIKTNVIPVLEKFAGFIIEHVLPVIGDIVTWLVDNLPKAINAFLVVWGTVYSGIYDVWVFIYNKLIPVFSDIVVWIGEKVSWVVKELAKFWNEILLPAITAIWGFISEKLLPIFSDIWTMIKDNVLPIFKDIGEYFDKTLGALLNAIAGGWNAIVSAVNSVIEAIKTVITWIEKAVNAMPDWLIPGSPTPFEIGLRGIASGFDAVATSATRAGAAMSSISLNAADIISPLTGFAGAIKGRFQSKFIDPLSQQKAALEERIAWLNELRSRPGQSDKDIAMYNQQIAKAQKEYTEVTQELIKYKQQEIDMEKQLQDLQFLQQQMDFIEFLRENELDIADILGDLQLGLDLDLPAFMDAITEALAQIVAQMNAELLNAGGPIELPQGFAAGGKGGGMAIYNNQQVNLYVSASISNGMDLQAFDTHILELVSGALR